MDFIMVFSSLDKKGIYLSYLYIIIVLIKFITLPFLLISPAFHIILAFLKLILKFIDYKMKCFQAHSIYNIPKILKMSLFLLENSEYVLNFCSVMKK